MEKNEYEKKRHMSKYKRDLLFNKHLESLFFSSNTGHPRELLVHVFVFLGLSSSFAHLRHAEQPASDAGAYSLGSVSTKC
jgi:hypothetical protein